MLRTTWVLRGSMKLTIFRSLMYACFVTMFMAMYLGCTATPRLRVGVPPPPAEVEISLSRQEFWVAIIAAIGGVVSSITVSLLNFRRLKEVHLDLNSRLGQMLENKMAEGRAQGELDSRSPRPIEPPVAPPNTRNLDAV